MKSSIVAHLNPWIKVMAPIGSGLIRQWVMKSSTLAHLKLRIEVMAPTGLD